MCGIAGFLDFKQQINDKEALLSTITNTLHHRGPDDVGIWLDNAKGIALGHRRLSIIDLSPLGHQPMHSPCGRYVIIFNGEIYNFLELKKKLIAQGQHFAGHSDTEVILGLITEYGIHETLVSLNGMFAIAIWDKKEERLHLTRDRIGEKPLYYGFVNNVFVFASELKAIRAMPNFNNSLSHDSLGMLLQYGYITAPHSIYNDLYKLMPGTYLTLNRDNIHSLPAPQTYWSMIETVQHGAAHPLHLTDTEAIEQTDKHLNQIIRTRMLSDVPIGAFLSGGVDSSLITALMQANSTKSVKSFTIGFNEQSYNEAKYAKKIAQYLNTEHTELYIDATDALSVIPRLPLIYDEPFADSSSIPTFLVSQLTRQHVTVCLSGDGGDEIFGGYNRYLFSQGLWRKLSRFPYPLRIAIQKLLFSVSPAQWSSLLRWINIPMIGDKLHKLAAIATIKSPEVLYKMLVSQWKDTHFIVKNMSTPLKPPTEGVWSNALKNKSFVEKMMVTDTLSYLPDDIMVKVDRAGMATSLESRAPFLDHELIEFMWKLPIKMKIRHNKTKWLLRQVLSKYIPNELIDRPKMGFGIPLDIWLRGPLRDWAENLLDERKLEQQGFFETAPILKKWQAHLSGKENHQSSLWTILMFQAWLENTVENA